MYSFVLDDNLIDRIKKEAANLASELMKNELVKVILYGSCARGDYTEDSDIDIALITKCNRLEVKKYDEELANIATDLAMKYFAIVNFVCLPYDEFTEKKTWYDYFRNIDLEGKELQVSREVCVWN